MATASRVHVGRLVQEASALAGVVRGSLGPSGGQVLLTRATGEVLLSRDGRRVLEALNVESPTARMMIACISAHCDLTGDGAKTFIILLSSLFQELEKLQGTQRYKRECYRFKQVSQYLMMIQTDILDHIVTRHLEKHLFSIFPVSDTDKSRSTVELVLEGYFCGKVGINRQKFLSQLSSSFFFSVTAGKNKNDVLRLVDEYFAELHTTVIGLPVSHSRILEGLILHRDFAVYCPTGDDKKVLIITEPIQSALSDLDSEINIMVESQYEASEAWITKRTELIIKHMQENNISVLLSSAKQEATVHHCAKQRGISIVECLSLEEISLICRITEISPFRPSLDNIHSAVTETAVVSFCQPLQLGTKRLVHIGFASTCVLQLHSVILCGPVQGVTEQHACAFRGAFRMLRQTFTAMPLMEWHELKSRSQNLSEGSGEGCSNSSILWTGTDQLRSCWLEIEGHPLVSPTPLGEELECSSVQTFVPSVDLQYNGTCSELRTSEFHLVGLQTQSQKCRHPRGIFPREEKELHDDHQGDHITEEERSRNMHMQPQNSKDSCIVQGYGISSDYEEDKRNDIQNTSKSFIKAGSVVPVGGIFEIQLHYYLSCYAKQCQVPSVSILCTLIANALLNIPKMLCSRQKRKAFSQLYLEVTRGLRDNQLLLNKKSLESVFCKYQLVVSVLHCAARLLSIDLIVGVKRPPQRVEESDSETDL